MTNHLKTYIFSFILLLCTVCLLTSCNEEHLESFEIPEVTHTCKMKLDADFTGFDAKDGSTRASINGWEDGDVLYLSFYISRHNYVGGRAEYDANNDDWTVTYSGSLSPTEHGQVRVCYFDGEVSDSTTLYIAPTVGIYADLPGYYKYSNEEGLYVNANLTPQTSRIRFKGTPGDSLTISGIETFTTYDCQVGSLSGSSISIPLHVASDGYTPYIYGIFADIETPSLSVDYDGCRFTKKCPDSMFQIGQSGWMNVPTRSAHENWEVEYLGEAHAVLTDSDNDGVGETLIFYYDEVDHSQEGVVYNLNTSNNKPEWQDNNKNITNVIFDPSFVYAKPTSTYFWFYNCRKLTNISGIKYLDTSNVKNMSSMFSACASLTELNVSNFNTSNVTSLSYMFNGCSQLTKLNLNSFDTSNVIDMTCMFDSCSSLIELNISNFNTSNVKKMGLMFYGCSGLKSLDVSNFNTINVIYMYGMFSHCSGLTSLNLSNFNTENVTNMNNMFSYCFNLTSLDISNFNTVNVTDMAYMFRSCFWLTSLDVSSFNTSNVTSMREMFRFCTRLTSLDVSSFNTSSVNDMHAMFCDCSSLSSLSINNFEISIDTKIGGMFLSCQKLSSINVGNNDFSVSDDEGQSVFEGVGSSSAPCNLIINSEFDTSVLGTLQGNYYYWRGGYFAEPTMGWDINIDHPYSGDKDL